MKCGKGHEHQTVAEVRACYGVTTAATPAYAEHAASGASQPSTRPGYATEPTIRYLTDLLGNRVIPAELTLITETLWKQCEAHDIDLLNPGDGTRMLARSASQGIELLKPLPRKAATPTPDSGQSATYAVPAGHYATPSRTGNNDLDFWRVDRPEQGQWAGRVFVKRVIGGHPNTPVRGSERSAALAAIAEYGADKAGTLYGTELGRCSKCNRHLTDETSRELGIGPECRSK